ncbi:MAG: HAMP domain-containing protein, partial [Proteobacteria bacterium]|nr:HAMP domain-containing protein [Pseudomonadota bacterium]
MSYLKNLRVRTRLTLLLVLMLGLIVANAYVAHEQIAKVNAKLDEVLQVQAQRGRLLNRFFNNFQDTTAWIYQTLINPERDASTLSRLREHLKQNQASTGEVFKTLATLPPDADINEGLRRIRALIQKNRVVQQEVITLMQQGLYPQAATIYSQLAQPVVEQMGSEIRRLVQAQTSRMHYEGESSHALYRASVESAIWIVLGIMLVGTLGGVLITRSITAPLSEAISVAQRVASGDLSVQVSATARDETGELLRALGEMVGKLTGAIASVRSSAEQLLSASTQVSATSQSLSQATT